MRTEAQACERQVAHDGAQGGVPLEMITFTPALTLAGHELDGHYR